jgi:hypothetical protein
MDLISEVTRQGYAADGAGDTRLVPTRKVLDRYVVCDRTLDRWLESPTLNFPKPIIIRRRKYWQLSELVAWEREQARAAAGGAHV